MCPLTTMPVGQPTSQPPTTADVALQRCTSVTRALINPSWSSSSPPPPLALPPPPSASLLSCCHHRQKVARIVCVHASGAHQQLADWLIGPNSGSSTQMTMAVVADALVRLSIHPSVHCIAFRIWPQIKITQRLITIKFNLHFYCLIKSNL